MSAIKVWRDSTFSDGGVFRLKWAKRGAMICLPLSQAKVGIVPSDDECRQAFNDTSGPGDEIAGPLTPVWRMTT